MAEYEKCPKDPKLSVEDYIKYGGFSDDENYKSPHFHCLIAIDEETRQPAGYSMILESFSSFYGKSIFLEDFYVKETYRGSRVGRQLFDAIVTLSRELGGKMIDGHVLSWNPATKFYKKMGAINRNDTDDWNCFRYML